MKLPTRTFLPHHSRRWSLVWGYFCASKLVRIAGSRKHSFVFLIRSLEENQPNIQHRKSLVVFIKIWGESVLLHICDLSSFPTQHSPSSFKGVAQIASHVSKVLSERGDHYSRHQAPLCCVAPVARRHPIRTIMPKKKTARRDVSL